MVRCNFICLLLSVKAVPVTTCTTFSAGSGFSLTLILKNVLHSFEHFPKVIFFSFHLGFCLVFHFTAWLFSVEKKSVNQFIPPRPLFGWLQHSVPICFTATCQREALKRAGLPCWVLCLPFLTFMRLFICLHVYLFTCLCTYMSTCL